jgi:predicted dehydrogenase
MSRSNHSSRPNTTISKRGVTRRSFVTGATALALLPTVTRNVLGANEKINIAGIGAGGKGAVDLGFCAGENIVALADVDHRNAGGTFKKFSKAKVFKDFRIMLDKEHKHIDAVTVSTPDHLHAVAAAAAMHLGKHVYCQKPLTHCVFEARVLTKIAREQKVVTQMGNQGHSQRDSRRLVEIIRSGALGTVTDIHVWTDRPIWPQGLKADKSIRDGKKHAVPSTLDWDLWLGPAKARPFNPAYLPFKWRGFWDFGTGALGDMGCHNMDLSFFALNLRDPTQIDIMADPMTEQAAPMKSMVKYQFPARKNDPQLTDFTNGPVTLIWYDGGNTPASEYIKEKDQSKLPRNGTIIIGSKDTLYVPNYWGAGRFTRSGLSMADFSGVQQTLPRRPEKDNDHAHHIEWLEAVRAGDPTKALSHFDYAGPMTEAVLLGNVALRAAALDGVRTGSIKWDAKNMKVINNDKANRFVRDEYRKGWALEKVV